MFNFKPARVVLSQTAPAPVASVPAPLPAAPAQIVVPAPTIVAYQGVPGVLEVVTVLAIAGSAAYIGVDSALHSKGSKRIASWVGGVGSGLLGLLYLGTRSGLSPKVLPQVTVASAA